MIFSNNSKKEKKTKKRHVKPKPDKEVYNFK